METFPALPAICAGNSPVPGEFPAQRPVTLSFNVFYDPRLNKRLSKLPWGWWCETLSCPLWRHCNDLMGCYSSFVRRDYAWRHHVMVTLFASVALKVQTRKALWRLHKCKTIPNSKVHGANMGPIWGRQDTGGPHVGPMNDAIWDMIYHRPRDKANAW